jgi:PAS domain S-box-containing protein
MNPNSRPITQARLPSKRSLRLMLLAPALAMLALGGLLAGTVWYLTQAEESQREKALMPDVDATQKSLQSQLKANELEMLGIAQQFGQTRSSADFARLSDQFMLRNQEVLYIAWIDRAGVIQGFRAAKDMPARERSIIGTELSLPESRAAFDVAVSTQTAQFSQPVVQENLDPELELHVPVIAQGRVRGALIAAYSLPGLLISRVPSEINDRVALTINDARGKTLAQTRNTEAFEGKAYYEVGIDPVARSLKLRGYNYLPVNSLYNDVVTTLIAGLILLAVISQIVIWRSTRKRLGAETELAEETAFRRAMENSMSTGMRVIDLNGQITYVNPAFSRMTGFSVDELTGHKPPFPYWPPETKTDLQGNLERMLSGESPPSGLPIQIMRKDGKRLTVRMYTSPLIDQSGIQTGWMTSVTDISEQTRIRQELAQAQERFITVLQALDAAVSVAPPAPSEELLFANQAYKKWFGSSIASGHRFLCSAAKGPWADVREIYSTAVQRWFEVRVRKIKWVDGRDVELMVATDITQERASAQAQREQREKLQQTSRLVTMGEMASSLAHELNQPLAAIANYTSGAAARLRNSQAGGDPIALEDLLEMLSKTARQAERAGQVIRRIRSFVKRSDPIRKPTSAATILADAIGLAEIDARERGLSIIQRIPEGLPDLNVDPILIEQVLLNLIKNGLEAMRESGARELIVEVSLADQQLVFSVIDQGHGVPEAIRNSLFDSFYTTKTDGMGMGLNICRSIIESHQGRLWFEDNPKGGCTFRFTLPAYAEQLPGATDPTKEVSL